MYRVLIVDDEQMIHFSLKKLIEQSDLGFELVGEAEDGREALELIQQTAPDLVITDIYMPELDGLELIEQAKSAHPKVTFMILSGYNDFSFAQKAIRFGVSDFLLKPIDPQAFLDTLKRIHHKLTQDKERFSTLNEWLTAYHQMQKQLFEEMWSLKGAQASATLEAILHHLQQRQTEEVPLTHLTHDLLLWLENELRKKGISLEEQAGSPPSSHPIASTLTRTRIQVQQWMQILKEWRNLGSRMNMKRALDYMKTHYMREDLSLNEVAGYIGISPAYFSRSFREEWQVTFIKYLINLRMEKARELLEITDLSTCQVALEVGFSDYPHFSKTFKKLTGVTPSEYRKQRTLAHG
ncbi:response regulator [Marinicrinis sediminis]|uniref:Response regulator n=1 Tax=Marinicrinis sediminis TaxID=1652465 RepID=A0ABW5R8M4_9BACL